jgi:hypothetical protein
MHLLCADEHDGDQVRANACIWRVVPKTTAWKPDCKSQEFDPAMPANYTFDFGGAITPLQYGYAYCPFCGGWLVEDNGAKVN